MHLEKKYSQNSLDSRAVIRAVPDVVLIHLCRLAADLQQVFYISGGTIRDILLGRRVHDLDITVAHHADLWARSLARCSKAPLIPLGRQEEAHRLIINNFQIDISPFRAGSHTIGDDLALRDLTINALAIEIDPKVFTLDQSVATPMSIIDPLNGLDDLQQQRIRPTSPRSFTDDPLRILRLFRFSATLKFSIDQTAINLVTSHKHLLSTTAGERINYELDEIMSSDRAAETFYQMADCGLLDELLPQLMVGKGMTQRSSHHLDVLGHCMAALESMEEIIIAPSRFFPHSSMELVEKYLRNPGYTIHLKWAALLHDIGKTTTKGLKNNTTITFYNHEFAGVKLIGAIAARLHWSNEKTRRITRLIATHMRPFHLCNVARKEELSLRACIRLLKDIGEEFPGLFLLAMADSSASKGEDSPETMQDEISALCLRLQEVHRENITPVTSQPPLLTGNDLINTFHLSPGPIFSKLLELVRLTHMEKPAMTKGEALTLVRSHLDTSNSTTKY